MLVHGSSTITNEPAPVNIEATPMVPAAPTSGWTYRETSTRPAPIAGKKHVLKMIWIDPTAVGDSSGSVDAVDGAAAAVMPMLQPGYSAADAPLLRACTLREVVDGHERRA